MGEPVAKPEKAKVKNPNLARDNTGLSSVEAHQRNVKMAVMRAEGATQKEIGAALGVNQSTVFKNLQRPEISELVERISAELMNETLSTAKENFKALIHNFRTTDDKDERTLGFKASQRVLESAGALNSNGTSIFIQNIHNSQNNTIISPVIQALLEQQKKSFEITYEEDEIMKEVHNGSIQ